MGKKLVDQCLILDVEDKNSFDFKYCELWNMEIWKSYFMF